MTYQEIVEDVWDTMGRLTDWPIYADDTDPATFDWALTGTTRILRYLRSAEVELSTAINKRGRALIWNHLVGVSYFKFQHFYDGQGITGASNQENPPTTATYTDPFGNVPKGTLAYNPFPTPATINQFTDFASLKGYVLEITAGTGVGQKRVIIDNALVGPSMVCAFNKNWDILPDATSDYKLYRNWITFNEVACAYSGFVNTAGQPMGYRENIPLSTVTEIGNILKIVEMDSGDTIVKGARGDDYSDAMSGTPSTPSSYIVEGNIIYFDTLVDPSLTFKFVYYKKPRVFVPANDGATATLNRPDFPEQWHFALIDKVLERFYRAKGEHDLAASHGNSYDEALVMNQFDGQIDNALNADNYVEVNNG